MSVLLLLLGCGMMGESSDVAEPGPAPRADIEVGRGSDIPDYGDTPTDEASVTRDDCDTVEPGEPVSGPGCLSGTIQCGDTIVGHTKGSVDHFSTKFYEKHFCTPATTEHDGGDERVYRLEMPAGEWTAEVYLDTPCADLDLAAMIWSGDECPPMGAQIRQCEMWPKDRNKTEMVKLVSQKPTSWMVVVEGKGEEEGAFSLTVKCHEGMN